MKGQGHSDIEAENVVRLITWEHIDLGSFKFDIDLVGHDKWMTPIDISVYTIYYS